MLNNHEPIFGKNVIETLSEGMYDNPLFLFREYVQNSADAIDMAVKGGVLECGEGQIVITIKESERLICFEDNGIGIKQAEVEKMLANIGDSQKDRMENKGFRGIGRLGGLGYCQRVRFETSALGETVETKLEWDAHELHKVLADKNQRMHAGELIKHITTTSINFCLADKHFFRVSLIDVNDNSDELLDADEIRKYLSMVAPVPFDYMKFRFVTEIEDFLSREQLPRPNEYNVFLNGDEVRKGYETPLKNGDGKSINILGVECHLITANKKTIGWYWYCISRFEGVLHKKCWQRCLRLRKSNIQIGEADCLSNHPRRGISLWNEDRGNNYFIGEVHALDEDLIPNSRRDYFNQDEACRRFESALVSAFKDLCKLYHNASDLRSSARAIQEANDARKAFEEMTREGFINSKVRDEEIKKVEELEAKSRKAQKKIEKIYDNKKSIALERVADEYMPDVVNIYDEINEEKFKPASKPEIGFAEDNIAKDKMSVLKIVFEVMDNLLLPEQSLQVREAIIRRFVK